MTGKVIYSDGARCDLDTEDFPTCAMDYEQGYSNARDKHLNPFTVPVGEAVRAKLNGEW